MGLYRAVPTLNAEIAAWKQGFRLVAGVDEVGCGPLAGPLLAGAVILDPGRPRPWWSDLRDSKLLEEPQRDRLAALIRDDTTWAVGSVSHDYIDEHGLTAARRLAMARAIKGLKVRPQLLLVDALPLPAYRHRSIIHGDALVASIAAAAIVAKVARDALMARQHRRFPVYGFDSNRGYASPLHRRALDEHGPCAIHRRLFAPVRQALAARGQTVTVPGLAVEPEPPVGSDDEVALAEAAALA